MRRFVFALLACVLVVMTSYFVWSCVNAYRQCDEIYALYSLMRMRAGNPQKIVLHLIAAAEEVYTLKRDLGITTQVITDTRDELTKLRERVDVMQNSVEMQGLRDALRLAEARVTNAEFAAAEAAREARAAMDEARNVRQDSAEHSRLEEIRALKMEIRFISDDIQSCLNDIKGYRHLRIQVIQRLNELDVVDRRAQRFVLPEIMEYRKELRSLDNVITALEGHCEDLVDNFTAVIDELCRFEQQK